MRLIQQAAPGITFEAAGDVLTGVRRHKDAAEIDRLRRAIAITEAALTRALEQFRPGMTEREIGALLQVEIIKGGGAVSFILAQGGESASNPHGDMSDRPVAAGEGLLLDFGALFEGYSADLTRTFVMGGAEANPRFREIYELVKDANAAGRAACGPGAIPQEVDRAARKVIEDGGYGEWFNHRTGHGLGLEIHEDPYIREGNTRPLEVGEVFTIEPGIYVPGLGGVRIEDNIVITEDGAACLTSFPREWRIVSS
jgi:Xaa-Pro aminopeptidase